MKKKLKNFFRDVYEGIYFLSRKHEHGNISFFTIKMRFFASFLLYYFSIFIIIIGIKVSIYGPFKPSVVEVLFYGFGVYFIIFRFIIYPLLYTDKVEENITTYLKNHKMKISILAQVIGFVFFAISFMIVYFLYKK